jgi:hypothetical protein
MPRKLISFDWAIKRLLRSKANFGILEGFLSELLYEDITIIEILESESNPDYRDDKYNRVDIKVKNSKDEIVIIEIQYGRELDYMKADENELREYESFKRELHDRASEWEGTYIVGEIEGLKKGEKIGIEKGEKIGLQKGEKIGEARGEKQKAIEIALNLLDVLDVETIALKTGLSIEEIEELRE